MKEHPQRPKAFFTRQTDYFSRLRDDVARNNLRLLRRSTLALGLFLLIYGLLTFFMMRNPILTLCYVTMTVAELAFLVFAHCYGRKTCPSYTLVQGLCTLFVLSIMAFTVVVSVFPWPDRPGIFYPMAYMLVTVLFIFPYQYIALVLTGSTAVYLCICLWIKPSDAYIYDLFAAITTWAVGFFFLYVITDLRLRDGELMLALHQASYTDSLTGLPNRRAAAEDMSQSFRHCQLTKLPVGVMMMDVDNFKQYNDTLGHTAGDDCLQAISGAIQSFVREHGLLAARYGGEEFAFLMPACSGETVQQLAEELLTHIRTLDLSHLDGQSVTVSLGAAVTVPGPEDTFEAVLDQADQALYCSKAAGKDQVTLWVVPSSAPM